MPSSTDVEFNKNAGEILAERLRSSTIVIVLYQPEILEVYAQKSAVLWDRNSYILRLG